MIIVGLLLIPIPIYIILKLNILNTKKVRIFESMFLLLISFLYIVFSFVFNTEPFKFNITSVSDYFLYSGIIFIFSPFLWIVLYYYCKKLFRAIRVHKNAKIKSNKEYKYYRDDLNKISPSIVMFTSIFDTDIRKSVSAIILKLKLNGYIQESNNEFKFTNIEDSKLLETEKMVLNYIRYNVFDEKLYQQLIEKEALNNKYIRKKNGGKFVKIIRIVGTILIPIVLIILSMKFDSFVVKKYEVYVLDNISYIKLEDQKEIEKLYYNQVKNSDDYYHSQKVIDGKTQVFYSYNLIRADKFNYSVVRNKFILDILDILFILLSVISVFIAIFMVIEQIRYFNKNYTRTIKGNELLNKAYALKNYLKDYSLIKNRTEDELILWEYYLIYSVVLDVNVKIQDKIIEKYISF